MDARRLIEWASRGLWTVLASFLCVQLASADVQILIEGQDGAAWDGQRYLLTDQNGRAEMVAGDLGDIQIRWFRNDGATTPDLLFLHSRFLGPHGERLQVGSYTNVTRLHSSTESATMELSGSCNLLSGSFEVLDVAYDADGVPVRLALDAIQYCGNLPRADRVRFRFNTSVPLDPPGVTAVAGADVRGSPGGTLALDASASHSTFAGALSYTWSQVSGPSIAIDDVNAARPRLTLPTITAEYAFAKLALRVRDSQGNEGTDEITVIVSDLQPKSQLSLVTNEGNPRGQLNLISDLDLSRLRLQRNLRNGISITYTGPVTGYTAQADLALRLSAPFAAEMAIGDYDLAYRYAFAPRSKSGLDLTFTYGCNEVIGHFNVLDAAYDELGHVERLAVDFVQRCIDGEDDLVTAALRYNSVVPLTSKMPHASAGENIEGFAGEAVSLDGNQSNGGATRINSYRWRQISGPAVELDSTLTPATAFFAPSVPPGGATLVFELTVRNEAGYEDTDTVSIRVLGPQDPRTWMHFEQYASDGCSFLFSGCDGVNFTVTRNNGDIDLTSNNSGGGNQEWIIVNFLDYGMIGFTMISDTNRWFEAGHVYLDLPRDFLPNARAELAVDGRGCNLPRSVLTVHELTRSAQGAVLSLAADLTTVCDGDPPAYAWIRINSTLPKTPPRPLASAGYDAEVVPGDVARLSGVKSFVGAGIARYEWTQISGTPVALTNSGTDATFTVPAVGGVLVFRLTVHGEDGSTHADDVTITVPNSGTLRSRVLMESDEGGLAFGKTHEMDFKGLVRESNANTFWINHPWLGFPPAMFNLTIHAPFDQPLGPSSYSGARDVNGGSRQNHDIFNAPGLAFDWGGWECSDSRGRYVVHEYVPGTSQTARIAIDLIQSCGLDGPLTRSAIRVNSAVPLRTATPSVSAGPDRIFRSGRTATLDGRYSFSWLNEALTYSWTQIAGPAVSLSNSAAVRPQFTAPAVTQDTNLRFELTITDASGRQATDAVNVIVLAPTTPSNDVTLQIGSGSIALAKGKQKLDTLDVVGPGQIEHTADDSYLEFLDYNAPEISLRYLSDVIVFFGLDPRAMVGQRLRTGTWTLGNQNDEPRMELGYEGMPPNSCSLSQGPKTLRIAEVEYDGNGKLTKLAFGYRADCNGIVLTGVAHFNSAAAVTVPDHIETPEPPTQPEPPTTPNPPTSGGGSGGVSSGGKSGGGGSTDLVLLAGLLLLAASRARASRRKN